MIFMAPNFPYSIFDPLSCTGIQWIVDKFLIEHSLHSVIICDIHGGVGIPIIFREPIVILKQASGEGTVGQFKVWCQHNLSKIHHQ